jgi:hypothetical protein
MNGTSLSFVPMSGTWARADLRPNFWYYVWDQRDHGRKFTAVTGKPMPGSEIGTTNYLIGEFETLDAAKSACQNDYETYGDKVRPGAS